MSISATINPRDIRELTPPRAESLSELQKKAAQADRLARAVEDEWDKMPEDVQNLFIELAYSAVEGPKGVRQRVQAFISSVRMSWAMFHGQEQRYTISEFSNSMQHVINAVFGAVERDNEKLQQDLFDAIKATPSEVEGSSMTSKERLERIREISNRATQQL